MVKPLLSGVVALVSVGACSAPVDVSVRLVNPCNQRTLDEVDFLRFEPRGEGIDSEGLSTIERVDSGASPPLTVDLTPDFQLLVSGHRDQLDNPASALALSDKVDLSEAGETLAMTLSLPLLDRFYATTRLEGDNECTGLDTARYGHTATWLSGPGVVLIVGGITQIRGGPEYRRVIETYNPSTGAFVVVGELEADDVRAYHTATALSENRVLIAGGQAAVEDQLASLDSALVIEVESKDAATVVVRSVMRRRRTGHRAVRLADGRVMVSGGRTLNPQALDVASHMYLREIEFFDPEARIFSLLPNAAGTGVVSLTVARYGHSATLLEGGQDVLIAGGADAFRAHANFEIVRVGESSVSVVPPEADRFLGTGAVFHSATAMGEGRVLFSGGYGALADAEPSTGGPVRPSASVEIWSVDTSGVRLGRICEARMTQGRGFFDAHVIDGRALFAGGYQATGASTREAEIAVLAPTAESTECFAGNPTPVMMAEDRARYAAAALPSGEFLVVGGLRANAGTNESVSTAGAEIMSAARRM